jgi:hypothetical protein
VGFVDAPLPSLPAMKTEIIDGDLICTDNNGLKIVTVGTFPVHFTSDFIPSFVPDFYHDVDLSDWNFDPNYVLRDLSHEITDYFGEDEVIVVRLTLALKEKYLCIVDGKSTLIGFNVI